ncbi:MAG: hypothetical protein AB7H93_06375 [Vicinamibacterales bacterium]
MRTQTTAVTVMALMALTAPASAQVIGTFSWQTQPYCNAVIVTVVQQGGLFHLTGRDNLCGAGTAPITGTAVAVGGNVALGFTIALPSGLATHISATISLAALSGTWSDGDGHTGAFVFAGAAGGSPRPAPAAATAITVNQFATSIYAGSGVAQTVARSDHLHDERYLEQGQPIVMGVSVGAFGIVPGTEPSSRSVAGAALALSADGVLSFPFAAPVSVGGTSYQLSQVEYCISVRNAGALVSAVAIVSDDLLNGVPLTSVVSDQTDRTTTGCYTVAVPASSARSFGMLLSLAGNATAGSIYVSGIRTTWLPVVP